MRDKRVTFDELITDLTKTDLVALTDEMVDRILKLIENCVDADVVFVPVDPDAHDPFASQFPTGCSALGGGICGCEST